MEKKSLKSLILSYGLILGLLLIAVSVSKYFLIGYLEKSIFESILGFIIIIIFIYLPINFYKKQNDGYLKLSEAIKIGLGVSLIGALIAVLYIYLFSSFIEPDFKDEIMRNEIEKMKKGSTPIESIKQAAEMMKNYMMPMMYFGIIIMNLILGLIISLITGLALKKENNNF